ncbi:hypothetical protein D3C85_969080 [compost metagenome]
MACQAVRTEAEGKICRLAQEDGVGTLAMAIAGQGHALVAAGADEVVDLLAEHQWQVGMQYQYLVGAGLLCLLAGDRQRSVQASAGIGQMQNPGWAEFRVHADDGDLIDQMTVSQCFEYPCQHGFDQLPALKAAQSRTQPGLAQTRCFQGYQCPAAHGAVRAVLWGCDG